MLNKILTYTKGNVKSFFIHFVIFFAMPLSGVLFSHLILGDKLTLSLLGGAALVAGGFIL